MSGRKPKGIHSDKDVLPLEKERREWEGIQLFLLCTNSCSSDWTFLVAIGMQPSYSQGDYFIIIFIFILTYYIKQIIIN